MGLITPIPSTDPRFRVSFDVYNNTLTLTDTYPNYSHYGGVYADIFSLIDPDGIIFWQNPGWALNDFSSPDLSNSIATKVLSGSNFPLDAVTNFVKKGVYTFSMKNTADGGNSYSVVTKQLNLDYTRPSPLIVMTADILASTLDIEDDTDYKVLHNGTSITPILTYNQTLVSPIDPTTGLPVVANVTSTALTFSVGPDIYTGTYQDTIDTSAVYSLELWDGTVWAIVRDTILGSHPETVRADTCMCQYYNCLISFQAQMDAANGTDPVEYARLRKAKDLLNDYMNMYLWAIKCGQSTVYWCNKIKDILKSTVPCDCAEDDDAPVEIIAVIPGGGGSSTPSTFVYSFGTGTAGFPVTANKYDVHKFTDTSGAYTKGDVYAYTGTTWVFEINDAGAAGKDGTNIYSSSSVILYNDFIPKGTPSGTGNTILNTYSIPANIMVNNGDQLRITANYELALNDNGKGMELTFNGDTIAEHYTDALINSSTKNVTLQAEVNRKTVAAQTSKGGAIQLGGFINLPISVDSTADLTAPVVINALGQNDIASASDVTCKQLCVVLFSKVNGAPLGVTAFAQGIASLTGGAPATTILFTSAFPSILYSISGLCYDSGGNPQTFTISNKTVNGFDVAVLVTSTLEWSCVLI